MTARHAMNVAPSRIRKTAVTGIRQADKLGASAFAASTGRMEQHTLLASSRGILRSCFAHNAKLVASSALLDDDLLSGYRPGGSIYVCTDALPRFVQSILPRIESPFVIVSGDSDLTVSAQSLGPTFDALLSSERLLSWFAQNCAESAPKLLPLPIGLDYHTMWEKPGLWGLGQVSPMAQEQQLLRIWRESPDSSRRYLAAYCNWGHALERGDRRQCFERLDRALCFFERTHVPRASSWARQAEFMFVVSPEGAGMDCHRTWEALALGCIPIVKRNPVCRLLAGLPVLIVDDWSEVRRERLEGYLHDFMGRRFDYSDLFLDTWVRKIHGLPPAAPVTMSHAEFRQLMTRWAG